LNFFPTEFFAVECTIKFQIVITAVGVVVVFVMFFGATNSTPIGTLLLLSILEIYERVFG